MLGRVAVFVLLLPGLAISSQVAAGPGKLRLTVAYCPTEFTGAGAIVEVDPLTGNFTITGTFKWPSDIIGCPADYDPIVTLDPASNQLYLYFLEEDIVSVVDVGKATMVEKFAPSDPFFTGFENMQYVAAQKMLKGVSGTVTEDGFCDDGCYQYGDLAVRGGKYTKQQLVPFKAVLDDSHFYDTARNTYWIQASYDLRDTICGHVQSDECLLALDADSGALKSAVYTNWTVYKYGPAFPDGTLLAWVEGFDGLCKHPYDDFLFAKVDLPATSITPIACIARNVTVHMDEWIASFSLDGSMMATGSGDAEAPAQLLVFNTADASTVINSDLKGLADQLKTADGLFFVWSVDWINA